VSDPHPPIGEPVPAPPKDATKRRRPRAAFFLVAALLPIVALLVAGEVFVRMRYEVVAHRPYEWPGLFRQAPAPLLWVNAPDYRGEFVIQTERLPMSTNALGLRDGPLTPERRSGARSVLFLGDSITFGRGVADGVPFANQLDARWSKHGAVAFNAGVSGYDTTQEAEALRRVGPELRPHLVVVGWYRNDIAEVSSLQHVSIIEGQFAKDPDDYQRFLDRVHNRAILDKSALLRLLRVLWKDLKTRSKLDERAQEQAGERTDETEGMKASQRALLAMKDWCDRNGARLAIIAFPAREETEAEVEVPVPAHLTSIEAFGKEHGIAVVQLIHPWRAWAKQHPGETLYLPRDRCHPNAAGHAQVAAWVDEALSPLLKSLDSGSR
jgi:lysophospholipase L1-like esterase